MRYDKRHIEVLDDSMASVLMAKTPSERLAIANGMWTSARTLIHASLKAQHPNWDNDQLNREVAQRLSHGAYPAH